MNLNNLPEKCFVALPSTGEMVIVKRGEMGYYPQNANNAPWGVENMDVLNKRMGVTKAQVVAMKMGSMVGWDIPVSNPDNYDEDGNWFRKS